MAAPQAFRNILYCSPPHPPITHMNAWKGYCRRLHERSLKNNENEKGISLFVIPYYASPPPPPPPPPPPFKG